MRIRNNLRATALLVVLFLGVGVLGASAAWEPGTQFRVGEVSGRPCLVDPAGRPFPYKWTEKLSVRGVKTASGLKPRLSPDARLNKSVVVVEGDE